MAGRGTDVLKGCGIGCGVVIVLSIVLSVVGGLALKRPFDDAVEVREAVDAAYGPAEDWRPPIDGVVAPDRMRSFMNVREALQEHCAGFTETFAQFQRMDELGDHPPAGTVVKELFGTIGAAVGMGGRIGDFNRTRNGILLDEGMGLGEYTYIYSLAYLSWLEIDLGDSEIEIDGEEASPRVRKLLRGMLANQYADAQAAGAPGELQDSLREELVRLAEDRGSYPWQGRVPAAIAASFEPYRDELEATYFPGMAPVELAVVQKGRHGFSYHGD